MIGANDHVPLVQAEYSTMFSLLRSSTESNYSPASLPEENSGEMEGAEETRAEGEEVAAEEGAAEEGVAEDAIVEESQEPTPPAPKRRRTALKEKDGDLLTEFRKLVSKTDNEQDTLRQYCLSLQPEIALVPEYGRGSLKLELQHVILKHQLLYHQIPQPGPSTAPPYAPTTAPTYARFTSNAFAPATSTPYGPSTAPPHAPTTAPSYAPTTSTPYGPTTAPPYASTTSPPFAPTTSQQGYDRSCMEQGRRQTWGPPRPISPFSGWSTPTSRMSHREEQPEAPDSPLLFEPL